MKSYIVTVNQHELETMRDSAVYLRAMAQTLGGDKVVLSVKMKSYAATIEDWIERVETTAVST